MDQIGRIVETINRLLKKFEVSHVQRVEEELSLEDKISLFYLINDEAKETLEFLQNRIREDIITEWCRELDEKKQREWKLRVFESLDLMQNYKALKCLGYNKTNLSEVRSLLQHAVTSVEFDVRKALYSTVDTLTLDQLDKVIRHIDPGRRYSGLYHPRFIEMFLLDWHIRGVISFSAKGLVTFQEKLDEVGFYEAREVLFKLTCLIEESNREELSCAEEPAESPLEVQPTCVNRVYPIINKDRVGLCLIVNIQNYRSSSHKPRRGAEFDCCSLKSTMSHMKIESMVLNDLESSNIFPSIEKLVRLHFDASIHSVLFVVIMAHGIKNTIYGVDGVALDTDEIRDTLSTSRLPCLKNKPKVIIFQSCRGNLYYKANTLEADSPTLERTTVSYKTKSSMEDYIICWSTLPGFKSYRDPEEGSLYIQTLCNYLLKLYNTSDLVSILLSVHNEFKNQRHQLEKDVCVTMVPECQLSMSAKLFLSKQAQIVL